MPGLASRRRSFCGLLWREVEDGSAADSSAALSEGWVCEVHVGTVSGSAVQISCVPITTGPSG
jgi:hypothetical protein